MRLLSRLTAMLAIVALGMGLAGPLQAQGKKVIISQAFQSMLYLPFYVAINKEYFKDEGLDLTKETAGSPTAALSAVLSGSANFSIHGPEWTAIAASKGAKVNIISSVVNGAAVWIAATPDFKYESVKDLKGQKIVTGMMPTTSTSLFLKLLKENGMDGKTDVDMLQVQIGTEPGPFMAGQAKVAVMYEPGLDQVVAKGMKVVHGFPQSYGPYAFSSVTARADADPDIAQRVVNAMEKAFRFIQKDNAGTVAIAQKEFPNLDPKVVEAAVLRMIKENIYPKSAETTADAFKTAMQTQIALGNLTAQPDYATFVVPTYVQKAIAMP